MSRFVDISHKAGINTIVRAGTNPSGLAARKESRHGNTELILAEGLSLLASTDFGNVTAGVLAQRSGMSNSGLFAHFGSQKRPV